MLDIAHSFPENKNGCTQEKDVNPWYRPKCRVSHFYSRKFVTEGNRQKTLGADHDDAAVRCSLYLLLLLSTCRVTFEARESCQKLLFSKIFDTTEIVTGNF